MTDTAVFDLPYYCRSVTEARTAKTLLGVVRETQTDRQTDRRTDRQTQHGLVGQFWSFAYR